MTSTAHTTSDATLNLGGDSIEVEFGMHSVASVVREEYSEHIHESDDGRENTVILKPDTPSDVVSWVRGEAAETQEEEVGKYGQIPLTRNEKKQLDFSVKNAIHARQAKALAAKYGVSDWLTFYEQEMILSEVRHKMKRAVRDEIDKRMDAGNNEDKQVLAAAKAHKRMKEEQRRHLMKGVRKGNDFACRRLVQLYNYTWEEVDELSPPHFPNEETETDEGDVESDEKIESKTGFKGQTDFEMWSNPENTGKKKNKSPEQSLEQTRRLGY